MNNDLLLQFTEHLKVLNRTPATIRSYTDQVRLFLKEETRDIKTITRADMEDYIATLYDFRNDAGKGYTIATICIKIRSLKRFFEFLEMRNIIFVSPMEFISEPKKEQTIPRTILTEKEMTRLLDQPNLSTRPGIRDRAILEVFYTTGIRLNELCCLTIYDADLQGGMLRINQGKGRKDRVVPLGKHAVRFLREYISKIRPHFTRSNRKCRALFVSHRGNPLSTKMISLMIKGYVQQAGFTKQVTAHSLRHTFASLLVKNGADVVAVQKMMGHADLSTTQGYIKALAVDLKKAHKKSHPREKDKVDRKSAEPNIKLIRPGRGQQL